MTWYYLQGDQTVGPVPESELERLIQGGTLSPEVQVWREGMADWQPYGVLKTPAVPARSSGLRIARHEPTPVSVSAVAARDATDTVIEIAPFGQRIVAKLIDLAIIAAWVAVIVGFCSWIATGIQRLGGSQKFQKSIARPLLGMAATLFGVCMGWFMRHWRATHKPDPVKRSIGKRLMRIVVVDIAGRPLGRPARFSRAVIQLLMVGVSFLVVIAPLLLMANRPPGPMRPPVYRPGRPPTFERPPSRAARLFVPLLTAFVLSQAGYGMALFNKDRRGLHDLICRTRVIVRE